MSIAVYNFARQYPVISVSTEPRRPERSVLAYSEEKTLRELLAEPSIASLGFDGVSTRFSMWMATATPVDGNGGAHVIDYAQNHVLSAIQRIW